VTEDEIRLVLRRSAVVAGDDLVVRPVDAHPECANERLARSGLWLRNVQELWPRLSRLDTDRFHISLFIPVEKTVPLRE